MELNGRVAVVTGASSGIGEGTARALAREGCAVAMVARREQRLEEIAAETDGRTLVCPTDVTDEAAVDATIERVRSELGEIDALVNNAGVARGGPVAEADLDELRQNVRVNLEGVMNVTHAALPSILEGGGDVLTVSSLSARFPQEGGSGYTASKFGVNGFCRSLRKEMSDEQVRVTVLMPGPVVTELNDWEHWEGRPMDPDDVADTVVFALSRPDHVELREISIDSTDKF
jgi:NADP-dependent 3-hydroxy acid dehydrogenase YdfG